MSEHLQSEEFVEHLEATLTPARERHLQECADCRGRVAEWETLAGAIREAGVVPEPSPLFWDHFSQRVQRATADAAIAPLAWWRRGRLQLGALAGVAAAVLLALNLQTSEPRIAGTAEPRNPGTPEPSPFVFEVDPASWDFITGLASSVPFEELRQATGPDPGVTDDMVAQLTPAQRAELLRLVKLEKGIGE